MPNVRSDFEPPDPLHPAHGNDIDDISRGLLLIVASSAWPCSSAILFRMPTAVVEDKEAQGVINTCKYREDDENSFDLSLMHIFSSNKPCQPPGRNLQKNRPDLAKVADHAIMPSCYM